MIAISPRRSYSRTDAPMLHLRELVLTGQILDLKLVFEVSAAGNRPESDQEESH